jgi:hypothetical protein
MSFKRVIAESIIPHLEYYVSQVHLYKKELTIDGVLGFTDKDVFVPGKVANAASYLMSNTDPCCDKYEEIVQKTRDILDFTAGIEMSTWGYINYVIGLYRLKQKGIFEKVVKPETEELLRKVIDWRTFVNVSDLSLIDKPTNYYNVAFAVAKYRELLGWENEGYSIKLFEKLMEHIKAYSGEYLFMDETKGEGRFDRYSVLVAGEVATILHETDMPIPDIVLKMLRKSTEIYLDIANSFGHGFSYGRSIGAYGDTSALEVLSISAVLNILKSEEKDLAYTYNVKIAEKFRDFWIDKDMKSINMWDHGRRTDAYRNKGRILGENLSLCMQVISSYEHWVEAGYEAKECDSNFLEALNNRNPYRLYRFCGEGQDRAMAIIRDQGHVFSLPLINGGGGTAGDKGGNGYYCKTPYLPVPHEDCVLEGTPDTTHPYLVPRVVLEDGTELMPVAYIKEIMDEVDGDEFKIIYTQDEVCKLGESYPQKDAIMSSKTIYTITPGIIEREDIFYPQEELSIKEIKMEFATYGKTALQTENKVSFEDSSITDIEAFGMVERQVSDIDPKNNDYHTPHGALRTKVEWKSTSKKTKEPISIKWKMSYKPLDN